MVQSDPEASERACTLAEHQLWRAESEKLPSLLLPNSLGHLILFNFSQEQPPVTLSVGRLCFFFVVCPFLFCFYFCLKSLDAHRRVSCPGTFRTAGATGVTRPSFPPLLLPEEWEDCWRGRAQTPCLNEQKKRKRGYCRRNGGKYSASNSM